MLTLIRPSYSFVSSTKPSLVSPEGGSSAEVQPDPPSFYPSNLGAKLLSWFHTDSTPIHIGLTQGRVSRWSNLVSGAPDLRQSDIKRSPRLEPEDTLAGRQLIYFNKSSYIEHSDTMQLDADVDNVGFLAMVIRPQPNTYGGLAGNRTNSKNAGAFSVRIYNGSRRIWLQYLPYSSVTSPELSASEINEPAIWSWFFLSNSVSIAQNGNTVAVKADSSISPLTLRDIGRSFHGRLGGFYVGEIVMCSELTSAEVDDVHQYLKLKWAL